jgi:hypothetical protein
MVNKSYEQTQARNFKVVTVGSFFILMGVVSPLIIELMQCNAGSVVGVTITMGLIGFGCVICLVGTICGMSTIPQKNSAKSKGEPKTK